MRWLSDSYGMTELLNDRNAHDLRQIGQLKALIHRFVWCKSSCDLAQMMMQNGLEGEAERRNSWNQSHERRVCLYFFRVFVSISWCSGVLKTKKSFDKIFVVLLCISVALFLSIVPLFEFMRVLS